MEKRIVFKLRKRQREARQLTQKLCEWQSQDLNSDILCSNKSHHLHCQLNLILRSDHLCTFLFVIKNVRETRRLESVVQRVIIH